MLKILVADDHAIVRQGVKQLLTENQNKIVYDEAGDGEEALAKALQCDYDLVLLDISMPHKNGLEVLKELRRRKPDLPVLIFTVHSEQDYVVRMLRLGASGYITKESVPDELMAAILNVASGGKYVSPAIAEGMVSHLNVGEVKHSQLSNRELQVMCLIAKGASARQMSERLDLSKRTIRTYRSRIHKKMNVNNDAELIRYVIENRLVI